MRDKLKKLFDVKFLKFLLVGVANTIFGSGIMFLLYNLCRWSYWPATMANIVCGSVLSYFLNKYFTFQNREKSLSQAVRFAVNIAVCYLLAYSIAQPLGKLILGALGVEGIWLERLTKIGGMGLYTILNYFGQRFFAFKKS